MENRELRYTKFFSDPNLVSYWRMEGNAKDYKGSNSGTSTNVTYGNSYGKFGQGGDYDGSSSYITLPNVTIPAAGTYSVWIKADVTNSGTLDYIYILDNNDAPELRLGFQSDVLYFYYYGSGGYQAQLSSAYSDITYWNHIVVVWETNRCELYVNGELKSSDYTSVTTTEATTAHHEVGYYSRVGSGSYFNGKIDDLALFNRALSPLEVYQLYGGYDSNPVSLRNTKLFNDPYLISYWPLDGTSHDAKNGNDGTDTSITYGPTYGKFAQGASFNGSSSEIAFSGTIVPLGAKTVSLWIKNSYTTNYQYLIDNADDYSGNYGLYSGFNITTGAVYFGICKGTAGTANFGVISSSNVCNGNWNHAVFTWDGTTNTNAARLYINGILENSATAAALETHVASVNLHLGRISSGGSYPLNGSLNDVAVFSRALSDVEVEDLYKGERLSKTELFRTRFFYDSNLLGYWRLEGNSLDSKNSYNGTDTNVTYLSGKFGQCGYYKNSVTKISHTSAFLLGDFSVSFWMKRDSDWGYNWARMIDKMYSNGFIVSRYNGTDKICLYANGTELQSLSTLQSGIWYHICAIRNGSTGYIYINGIYDNSGSINGSALTNTDPLGFGDWGSQNSPFENYHGYIDDVAIFNRALSAAEVSEIYNGPTNSEFSRTKFYNDINLVGYWRLNGNSSITKGSLGNGTDTNITYGTKNGKFGQGASFNGSNSHIAVSEYAHRTNNFTYSWWTKWNGSLSTVGSYFSNGTWTNCLLIRQESASEIDIYCMGSFIGSFSFTFTVGTWYHLVLIKKGSSMDFYVNGVYISGIGFTSDIQPSSGMYFGESKHSGSECINACMDDILILSRALSPSEIMEIYTNRRLTPLYDTHFYNDTTLISYYPMEGSSTDAKGSNTGTDTSVSYDSYFGVFGQGSYFNGTSSKINFGSAFNFTTENFTFSFWIFLLKYVSEDPGGMPAVLFYKGGWQLNGYYCQVGTNGAFSFFCNQSGAIQGIVALASSLPLKVWNYVTIVRKGSSGKIYVNGVDRTESCATLINPTSSSDSFVLGCYSTLYFTQCFFDDVAIFSRALYDNEVQDLYYYGNKKRSYSYITSGLMLYLDANDRNSYPGTGTAWNDLSGNGKNFTLDGSGIVWSSDGYFNLADGGMGYASSTSTSSTSTLVFWIKTTDEQALFWNIGSAGYYLGAYRVGNKEYYGSCGTPDYYQDLVHQSNIYDYIRDGVWHMIEFKNTDLSAWSTSEFNRYSTYTFGTGSSIAIIQVYNKNLSATESLQNFEYFRKRFNI